MLESLTVRDFALIDHLDLHFGPHLNVLTGETGAGKSIIVGALGLLLGARGGAAEIRTGADSAQVSAVVRLDHDADHLRAWLAEHELPLEEDGVILRRTVRRSGRSTSFIGGVPVQTAQLAQLGQRLFDLHGQHEHQSLLREDQHRRLLDRYAELEPLAGRVAAHHAELAATRVRRRDLERGAAERQREVELLQHAVDEIGAARLAPDEEQELDRERRLLTSHEQISAAVCSAYERTAEAGGGALAALRAVLDDLRALTALDATFATQQAQVESAFYELEEVADSVRRYRDRLYFDGDRLEAVNERLDQIRALQRKYGESVAAVIAYAEQAREQLARLEHAGTEGEAARRQERELQGALGSAAAELSTRRRAAAAGLHEQVQNALRELGMPRARFTVSIEPRSRNGAPVITATGAEVVSFQISANAGEPLKPLRAIASGGEISRVMLALKSIFAAADPVGTLVFDEVDAGIGGTVALAVGDKLAQVAQRRQILCITHLATLAARAQTHLQVRKRERDGRTVITVAAVAERERVTELARMLSGDDHAEVSLRHAAELLARHGP